MWKECIVKNYEVMELLITIKDLVIEWLETIRKGDIEKSNELSLDVWDGVTFVKGMFVGKRKIRLGDACVCALDSLIDIKKMLVLNYENAMWKAENELLMIIENMIVDFYCDTIYDKSDESKKELRNLLYQMGNFSRLLLSEEEREYEYDLSIYIPAYNHLDMTKLCIRSLLNNLPHNCSFEIILHNHGSNDGTKEYFESIQNAHVINSKINRAHNVAGMRSIRGKYILFISNDILIGKNVIDNLYRTVTSSDKIGWVVPSTNNVSNLQTIEAHYNDVEEYNEFTLRNNIYSEKRHEIRTRLCDPVHILKTDIWNQMHLEMYEEIYCVKDISSFPDDKFSLWMRRNNYKSILAKDSYCHHYGSVTHKADRTTEEWNAFYMKGRQAFEQKWGIDPWGKGFCFDLSLEKIVDKDDVDLQVIGIDCGIGANSLKVREKIYELSGRRPKLVNYTSEHIYVNELKGISDEVEEYQQIEEIINAIDMPSAIVLDNRIDEKQTILDAQELFLKSKNIKTIYINCGEKKWKRVTSITELLGE